MTRARKREQRLPRVAFDPSVRCGYLCPRPVKLELHPDKMPPCDCWREILRAQGETFARGQRVKAIVGRFIESVCCSRPHPTHDAVEQTNPLQSFDPLETGHSRFYSATLSALTRSDSETLDKINVPGSKTRHTL
jgi:hypothetical protein